MGEPSKRLFSGDGPVRLGRAERIMPKRLARRQRNTLRCVEDPKERRVEPGKEKGLDRTGPRA